MNDKIKSAFADEMEKISAIPPKVPSRFAKEKIFTVKKREVPIKGIRAAKPTEKIAGAFLDELRKIGVKLSERPTQLIKKHSETEIQRAMAKMRGRGKVTGPRVQSMYAQYRSAAPTKERVLRGKM